MKYRYIKKKIKFWPYGDAIAVSHGDPHGHGGRRDHAAHPVGQRETEIFPVVSRSFTGEAG